MDACVWGGVFRTIINTSGKKASMCSREDRAVREMCPFCLAGGLLGPPFQFSCKSFKRL